jgi:hypothetical protein
MLLRAACGHAHLIFMRGAAMLLRAACGHAHGFILTETPTQLNSP